MIDPKQLLTDLQKLLKRLEPDIRNRFESNPGIDARLRGEYDKAKSANRTAQAYEIWRDDYITQVAVAWILGCVFVRFLEDNGLIDTAWLAGPNDRLQLARDQHTLYFQGNPTHSDREYLEHVFREVANLPSMRELLDGSHNPISKFGPTGDGAHELLDFWQKVDPSTGAIIHDFTDSDGSTRFLGDLYQDLSESTRKRYALLQTPEFVEEFILDRTLAPAIEEFGYAKVKLIDPTCGSGHFLLGGFNRLYQIWARHEPGLNLRELAQRALDAVFGVDLNPNVVAIARFRLLIAALRACGIRHLKSAPGFNINLVAGDSLLHGPRLGSELDRVAYLESMDPLQHVYETEDAGELRRILGQQYHAVVGNPPYITVSDSALNGEYRKRFASCHRQYSLAVPFMERFFHLALSNGGYVGMITANSFMKREFGKKLVESYIPRWDLTHVIDTAGAYIPGHGTPTVILFGRHRKPVRDSIRAVMGIRGEPQTPQDPAHGLVWSAIQAQVDHPGSESRFVSVTDTPRASFHRHPWSIGGGGAAELKGRIDAGAAGHLNEIIAEIGRTTHTGEDDAFYFPEWSARTHNLNDWCVPLVLGEDVRDYCISPTFVSLFPYDKSTGEPVSEFSAVMHRHLWRVRSNLANRRDYGQSITERGLRWFDHSMFFKHRYRTPLSIAFAFVATHNHFVLDRGGKVFNRSAPVIKLPPEATEDDYHALIGLLNSSTACFWMKQVFYPKGGDHVGTEGARIRRTFWDERFEHDGTKLEQFPLCQERPPVLAKVLGGLAAELSRTLPAALSREQTPSLSGFGKAKTRSTDLIERMIALQEELDWQCYRLYGLTDEDLTMVSQAPPPIRRGERAFEISMARKMADGELETTWFVRHGSTPITELPPHWPADYRALVERRISVIESDRDIALIEQPEYKRRWNPEPCWAELESRALRGWLLDRMQEARYWSQIELTSCAKLADCLNNDVEFRQVAELYRGRSDFDLTALIVELIETESVPLLAAARLGDSGLRKHAVWERTWDLQRHEDAVDANVQADQQIPDILKGETTRKRKAAEVGDIHVPPKYDSKDFQEQSYWLLRGKLDVPKERFTSFPFCERDVDQTPVIGWAGWDHLQQAQAIASYYERVKNHEGWTPERRTPLLTGILELIPWLKQWHNDIHREYRERMGDFFQQFVEDEARAMEMTLDQIRQWTPPVQSRTRGRKKRNT